MSINDNIIVEYSEKYKAWWATQGRETFYDADNNLITWETWQSAENWLTRKFPHVLVIVVHNENKPRPESDIRFTGIK